ncbi:MAG TPA: thioredoxin domain-containing protein [Bacteroidales bacterium]|nr:thioredoxin domain-containing protein [Bacteroidales bacterium]
MVEHLTKETFLSKVFNYYENTEWKFAGQKPTVIDFYADWCAPCRSVSPVFDELSKEFEGMIDFYKVDTEAESELAAAFGIRSIPAFLFIPTGQMPQLATGALPKEVFKRALKDILGIDVGLQKSDVGQNAEKIDDNTESN